MLKRFIQQITRLLAGRRFTTSGNLGLNVAANIPHSPVRNNGSSMRGYVYQHRPNRNGEVRRRDSGTGLRHNAEQLLRDGHLRIAITGFNDTAFEVSVMSRHDSPRLALAVSDLPCKIKMVARRNIGAGLIFAMKTLEDTGPGRRGIVLITSGDADAGKAQLRQMAEEAAAQRIGIHVICFTAKAGGPTEAPRINTQGALGYGGFRTVESPDQLLAAIREAFTGLTPAFGMRGTNKAVILLDCSETMVEAYHNTMRIDLVITALQEFLKAPLARTFSFEKDNRSASCFHTVSRRKPISWQCPATVGAPEAYDWSPRST
jgi:hypothetical protein